MEQAQDNKTFLGTEPVADGIAVLCTVMIFAVQFKKALRRLDEART